MGMESVEVRVARLEERIDAHIEMQKELRQADQRALEAAFKAASELAEKHNDLIQAMQARDLSYARKEDLERVEARLNSVVPSAVYDEKHDALVGQVSALQKWQANVTGRSIGLALVGGVLVATVSAFVTHLIS